MAGRAGRKATRIVGSIDEFFDFELGRNQAHIRFWLDWFLEARMCGVADITGDLVSISVKKTRVELSFLYRSQHKGLKRRAARKAWAAERDYLSLEDMIERIEERFDEVLDKARINSSWGF